MMTTSVMRSLVPFGRRATFGFERYISPDETVTFDERLEAFERINSWVESIAGTIVLLLLVYTVVVVFAISETLLHQTGLFHACR